MAKADKRARKRANQAKARQDRMTAQKRASQMRMLRLGGIGVAIVVIIVAIVAFTGGSSKKKTTPKVAVKNSTTTTLPATTTTIAALKPGCVATVPPKTGNGKQYKSAPAMTIDPTKTYTATFDTTCGKFTATLDAKDSPKGVNNFVFLARQGFYNGLTWHRVVKDFVIQGGDPTGTGSGGPGYSVVTETPKNGYKTGDLAWAKTQTEAPGTAGSQFFVTTGSPAALNSSKSGNTYAYGYFGHVTSGLANAQKLESYFPPATQDGAPTRPLYIFSITITES